MEFLPLSTLPPAPRLFADDGTLATKDYNGTRARLLALIPAHVHYRYGYKMRALSLADLETLVMFYAVEHCETLELMA